jgi:hypothetical protein
MRALLPPRSRLSSTAARTLGYGQLEIVSEKGSAPLSVLSGARK